MELTQEKIEKLKEKSITLIEKIANISYNKELDLDIELKNNFVKYSGLTLRIRNNYFGCTTDKTNYKLIYTCKNSFRYNDSIYYMLNENKMYSNIDYYVLLDLLLNENMIIDVIENKIKHDNELINSILN